MESIGIDNISFLGFDCLVLKGHYANRQVALQLIAAESVANRERGIAANEPITVATVCLPAETLPPNETVIRTYSENEGLLEVLEKADIVALTGRDVACGYARCPIVTVLV